ncbi:MAG: hypothetical protein J6Z34_05560 [Clostridia bacterium]|nr:hypothetical protein [Clostridia bacterium]
MNTMMNSGFRRIIATLLSIALVFAFALTKTSFSFGSKVLAEDEEEPEAVAYIAFANTSWSTSIWGPGQGGAANELHITGSGNYTLSATVSTSNRGINGSSVAVIVIEMKNAAEYFPTYAIKLWDLKINGSSVTLPREAPTFEEDDTTTRMNIFNAYVNSIPDSARNYDGDLTNVAPNIFTQEEMNAITGIKTIEVTFSFMEVGAPIDTAYIAYNGSGLSGHYDAGNASYERNTPVVGRGNYTVGLQYSSNTIRSLDNFTAVIVANAATDYPGATIKINSVTLGRYVTTTDPDTGDSITELVLTEIDYQKGYTNDEDGHIRTNLYNSYVASVPSDARSWDGDTTDSTWLCVDPTEFSTAFAEMWVNFDFYPIDARQEVIATLEFEDDADAFYFAGSDASTATATTVGMKNVGNYEVSLDFTDTTNGYATGLKSFSLKVLDGETYYAGWVLQIKEIRINNNSIIMLPLDSTGGFLKTFTYSPNYAYNEENERYEGDTVADIWNTSTADLPDNTRTIDGIKRDASRTIIQEEDLANFDHVENITVAFRFVYAEPVKPVDIDWEEHFEGKTHNFYMGMQMADTYIFRNSWCDVDVLYGLGTEYFDHLYRTDTSTDCGGVFTDVTDVQLSKDGADYEVRLDLAEEDNGFMTSSEFLMLFVSTDIYWDAYAEGRVNVTDVYVMFDGEYLELGEPKFIALDQGKDPDTGAYLYDESGLRFLGIYIQHSYSNFMPILADVPTESIVIGFTVSYNLVEDPTTLIPPTVTFAADQATIGEIGKDVEIKVNVTSENTHLSEDDEIVTVITVTKGNKTYEVTGNKFTPDASGEYVITITATDALGNETTITKSVIVRAATPVTSEDAKDGSSGCGGSMGVSASVMLGVLVLAAAVVLKKKEN